MRTCREIAEAVAGLLNQPYGWRIPFIAEVHHRPRHDLENLEHLRVSVVPRRMELKRLSRADVVSVNEVEVAVQKKIAYQEEEQDLHALTRDIAKKLSQKELPVVGSRASGVNYSIHYSPEHYDEMQVFTAVVQAEYIA